MNLSNLKNPICSESCLLIYYDAWSWNIKKKSFQKKLSCKKQITSIALQHDYATQETPKKNMVDQRVQRQHPKAY